MLIIPAIDLRAGRAVRLLRGEFARETVYGEDPLAVARGWRERGATLLHVVDLDATLQGRPVQLDLVRAIATETPVQLGGGLRTSDTIASVLHGGIERAVVGTAALDATLVGQMVEQFGDRLVVALDTRNGMVAVEGWTEGSDWTLLDLARQLIEIGVSRFLHTDVERDGAMTSPNFTSLAALLALGKPVIASGGVASLEHIRRLREMGAEAVIVGRALYEGTVTLEEAIRCAG